MTKNKQKKPSGITTVQVTTDMLLAIKNEQNRLLNLGQGIISQSDMVHRLWVAYNAAMVDTRHTPGSSGAKESLNSVSIEVTDSELPCVRQVVAILRSGNVAAVEGLGAVVATLYRLSGTQVDAAPAGDAESGAENRFGARIQDINSAAKGSGRNLGELEKATEERKKAPQRDKLGDN